MTVLVSVGAVSTAAVLALVEDAQDAGAAGAASTGVRPAAGRAGGLWPLPDVTAHLAMPLCVYDNPTTTGFVFTDELLGRIAHLPGVASLNVAPVPADPEQARRRLQRLRAVVAAGVSTGGAAVTPRRCPRWRAGARAGTR